MLMLPLMYFSRKLDNNDPDLVFKLRCGFYTVQALVFSLIAYLYSRAVAFKKSNEGKKKVFVTKAAEPFADPNAKKKYTEVELGAHIVTTITSLAGSTAFGVCIQSGLHWYNGMIAGFASQLIMAPINILDSPVTKFFLFGSKDAFETKTRDELLPEDEIVDTEGNAIVPVSKGVVVSKKKEDKKKKISFEEIMLDTWDIGAKADMKPFMQALTKQNVNHMTSESGWTPIMVMSGLGVENTTAVLETMKKNGADPSIVDKEGWNALHWSAFHGCAEAARYLLSTDGFDGFSIGLHTLKDNEGKTALEHSEAEDNLDVSEVIKKFLAADKSEIKLASNDNEGLRKRR